MTVRGRGTRVSALVVTALVGLFSPAPPAQAQPTVTASDGDDVGDKLDIRFATLSPESGGRSRITLTFWNHVPPRALERHSIRLELDPYDEVPHKHAYVVAFFLNGGGFVRMTWGESGSNCCFVVAGEHPDDFTYTGVLPFSMYGAQPPPKWLRGVATRRHICRPGDHRACALFAGGVADRTRWVAIGA